MPVPILLMLLTSQVGGAHEEVSAETTVGVTAKRLRRDGARRLLVAEGDVVLRTIDGVLRADELRYDEVSGDVQARGRVRAGLARRSTYGAQADAVSMKIENGAIAEVALENGVVMLKTGVSPEELAAVGSRDELRAAGFTSMVFEGARVRRTGEASWSVDELSFNPCDCGAVESSWRITAAHAHVDAEAEYATLSLGSIRLGGFPVIPLPWLYVPLAERRTGFLVPKPITGALNGFGVEVPFFWALNRSHDLTLTGSYLGGGDKTDGLRELGVRGPRLLVEYNYAPSTHVRGRASAGLLYDLKTARDPLVGTPTAGVRGPRGELSLRHAQSIADGWAVRADLSAVSDGYYVRDLTADIFAREQEYLRSTATLTRATPDVFFGLGVGFRQDLHWGFSPLANEPITAGPLAGTMGPNTFHQLPAMQVFVPEFQLAGPIQASLRADFARLAPLTGLSGDEGSLADEGRPRLPTPCLRQRLWWDASASPEQCGPPETDEGQGDRLFQRGERQARDRVDVFPRLSLDLALGEVLRLGPYLGYRQDFYYLEVDRVAFGRGYPIGGVIAESTLARSFADGRLWHVVEPIAELRYVPRVFGHEPAPYDELDRPFEGSRLFQAEVQLRQRLLARGSASVTELARLDLGQTVDLYRGDDGGRRLGGSFGRLLVSAGPVTLSGLGRLDPNHARFEQVTARLMLHNGAGGEAVEVGYDQLFAQGTERSRRGIDSMVGATPFAWPDYWAQQLSLAGRLRLDGGFALSVETIFARQELQTLSLAQTTVVASYSPPCECFTVNVRMAHRPDRQTFFTRPDVMVDFSVAHLGSFGTGF